MNPQNPKDPLHGMTLEMILTELIAYYGWGFMAETVRIRCFMFEPTMTSSLRFLRRTPWARAQVETLYRQMLVAQKWDRPTETSPPPGPCRRRKPDGL